MFKRVEFRYLKITMLCYVLRILNILFQYLIVVHLSNIYKAFNYPKFMKKTIDHHASILIVRAGDLFFFNGYDQGYPRKEWVGCLNPLGGNYEACDVSPFSLLEREIFEEMTDPQEKFPNFAHNEAEALRNFSLKYARAYQDFIIVDPVIEKNKNLTREQRSAIVSFYYAEVPEELIRSAGEALREGKRVVSEGDGGSVVSLQDLVSGARNLAWANPFMMSCYLEMPIPFLREGSAESIGGPRQTLADYLCDFDYIKPIVNAA